MLVPKLRFNEFEGEWELTFLENLYTFRNGINGERSSYGTGIKYISVSDILNNNFITYDNIRGKINISDKIFKQNQVDCGDILFQRSSETRTDIGKSNVYLDNRPATFGGFVIRGKKKNNYNPIYINYLLQTQQARKNIIFRGAGSQHYNIGQEDLKKVNICLSPSNKEQDKIANTLQLLDKKIELQSKKIEALKLYKLYTKSVVLNTNDNEIKLSEILTKWNKKNKDNCINYVESVSNKYGFISQKEQFEDRNVASSNLENYYVIEKNVFAYNPSRLDVGSLALKQNDIISVVSPLYECFTTNENNIFMLEWFDSIYFKKQTLSKFEGGVRNTLSFSNLSNIKIKLPKMEIQNKISALLKIFNNKINKENEKLQKLKELKKGLMQSMFV